MAQFRAILPTSPQTGCHIDAILDPITTKKAPRLTGPLRVAPGFVSGLSKAECHSLTFPVERNRSMLHEAPGR